MCVTEGETVICTLSVSLQTETQTWISQYVTDNNPPAVWQMNVLYVSLPACSLQQTMGTASQPSFVPNVCFFFSQFYPLEFYTS